MNDLRFAVRALARTPAFAAIAILSLALGLGANTAIFSVANAVLLRPISGAADPGSLVRVYRGHHSPLTYQELTTVREENAAFTDLVGERMLAVARTSGSEAERLVASITAGRYFVALGVRPQLGSFFDDDPGSRNPDVVVLSDRYWRRRFAANPAVIGTSITLNGHPFTIVGVTDPAFSSSVILWSPDVFLPTSASQPVLGVSPDSWGGDLYVTARLKPGVTRAQAEASLAAPTRTLRTRDPQRYRDLRFTVDHARGVNAEMRTALTAASAFLLVIVGLVLAIACANVANLLLARAAVRRREIGIRLAIGASRWRLVRQLLVESLILSVLGGAAGLMLASWLAAALARFVEGVAPQGVAIDFSPNEVVLAYTALLCVGTAIVFGLAPALQAVRPSVVASLRDDPAARGYRRSRLRSSILAVQVALCTVLLACATLFLHSLANSQLMNPGFDTRNLLDVSVDAGSLKLDDKATAEFYRVLSEKAAAVPGVRGVTLAALVPLGGSNMQTRFWRDGMTENPNRDTRPFAYFNVVGPEYFHVMGVPMLRGRDFTADDRLGAPAVAIVNETFASRIWPGQDPLGKRLSTNGENGPWVTIVGVARNTMYNSLGEQPPSYLFLPFAQNARAEMVLQARVASASASIETALAQTVREMDGRLPPANAVAVTDDMRTALLPAQMGASLLTGFGVLALLLSAVGIYGVASYGVAQRTREIGIRTALGAPRRAVLRLVLRESLVLVLIGLASGLAVTLGVGRLLASQLYEVSPTDPVTFAATSLLLLAIAALATFVPARRATHVDPMTALRGE